MLQQSQVRRPNPAYITSANWPRRKRSAVNSKQKSASPSSMKQNYNHSVSGKNWRWLWTSREIRRPTRLPPKKRNCRLKRKWRLNLSKMMCTKHRPTFGFLKPLPKCAWQWSVRKLCVNECCSCHEDPPTSRFWRVCASRTFANFATVHRRPPLTPRFAFRFSERAIKAMKEPDEFHPLPDELPRVRHWIVLCRRFSDGSGKPRRGHERRCEKQ